MRAVIEDMAQPMPGYAPWEQGHGLITFEIVHRYLPSLDQARLERLMDKVLN